MATPIPANDCPFTLAEAADATAGELFGPREHTARGISIDTRSLSAGAIFVALLGVADGHRYLAEATRRGAAAAVVNRGRRIAELPCIEVDDTLEALGALARYHLRRIRRAHEIPSIAVGGAAGKTTTKEITAALARAIYGPTLATTGNLNNRIGVPMTLLTLSTEHRAMVIECGTNTRGEIPRLAAIVEPDVAMVLNVDLEHTEGLGTLADVADEESALMGGARRAVVFPADDPMLAPRAPRGLRAVTFGASAAAHVRLEERSTARGGKTRIRIRLAREMVAPDAEPVIESEIAMLGEAAALNCAAAVAAVGATAEPYLSAQNLAALETALASVTPVTGRLSLRQTAGIVLIDDTYNANPRSVRAALAAAREIADGLGARLIIALGDMFELGELSARAHAETLADVMRARPSVLVAVGPEMARAVESAPRAQLDDGAKTMLAADSREASRIVRESVCTGDVLLVKGSRGMAMERIIESLESGSEPLPHRERSG